MSMHKKTAAFAVFIIGLLLALYLLKIHDSNSNIQNPTTLNQNADTVNSNPSDSPVFDKSKFSLTQPDSIWFIANKHFSLPLDYTPSQLVVLDVPLRLAPSQQQMNISHLTANELTKLFTDAKNADLQLQFGSGYRPSSLQRQFYNSYVAQDGQEAADTYSARPGHSEHQTGLALDFTREDGKCHLEACFGDLPEGKWLSENAHLYGFVLRYPENLDSITGYTYEPWHFRYVGVELATEMKSQGINTLEEFFGLAPAPNYLN